MGRICTRRVFSALQNAHFSYTDAYGHVVRLQRFLNHLISHFRLATSEIPFPAYDDINNINFCSVYEELARNPICCQCDASIGQMASLNQDVPGSQALRREVIALVEEAMEHALLVGGRSQKESESKDLLRKVRYGDIGSFRGWFAEVGHSMFGVPYRLNEEERGLVEKYEKKMGMEDGELKELQMRMEEGEVLGERY